VKFAEPIDKTRVHPRLWMFLTFLDDEIFGWSKETEITVTSLRRPFTGKRTKHAAPSFEELEDLDPERQAPLFVLAADVRRWGLDAERADAASEFCQSIQARFGVQMGVVLEPDWLSRDDLYARGLGQIKTLEDETAARAKVDPHIHFQLKLPILWSPFR